MRDPGGLYDLSVEVGQVPTGLHLIAGLTGFADAGNAVTQLSEYLLENLEMNEVVAFDTDALLDYRARRPTMYFDQDHLSDYKPSKLSLYLTKDELGQPFLFLTGFEPDFQWERFTDAVVQLVERYKVKDTTWVHAIPMPTPHTRPIGVTVSGNRMELIDTMSIWRPRTQIPSNALHLIEYKLQQLGHPTAGFVLLIPHYLSDTAYPQAAVTALESISAATGLIFPTEKLRQENRDFLAKVDDQVQNNSELQRLVGALEERHDSYMEDNPLPSPLMDASGELPGGDSLAAELEKFLANRRDDEN
ncbi:MAG: PAC2 family protein [Pseudolysinimonas sp.]